MCQNENEKSISEVFTDSHVILVSLELNDIVKFCWDHLTFSELNSNGV